VPSFSYVEVYPPTGFPERPWCGDDPDRDDVHDAFVKSARSVTELYWQALAPLKVPNHCSMLRLACSSSSAEEVIVTVSTEKFEGMEMGRIHVPRAFLELTHEQRARLVLDAVHGAVLRLAEARGWDPTLFAPCRQHVLDAGLVYRWDALWKSSPDRRHRARARYHLTPDGYGRVRIEVQRREDGTVVAVSQEAVAFSTSRGFQRSARTLRWVGSAAVGLVPYAGLLSAHTHGSLRLERDEDGWHSRCRGDVSVLPLVPGAGDVEVPRVVVRGVGINAPEQAPRVVLVGGGPMNGVSPTYDDALHTLLRELTGEAGQRWWQDAGLRELELWYDYAPPAARVRTRVTGPRLKAVVERPAAEMCAAPKELAAADVRELVAQVRRRTGLGPHPTLPG
jgi:hypothetical protein